MKNLKQYIKVIMSSLGLVILFSSCDEEFLTKYPQDALSAGTFFKTESDFEAAVNGIYDALANGSNNGEFFPMNDMATPFSNGGGGRFTVYNIGLNGGVYGVDSNWRMAKTWWPIYYRGIQRANTVLEYIDNEGVDMSEEAHDKLKGETLFMRAYFYHTLVELYGNIPLITSVQGIDEIQAKQASKEEVYTQIIDDLQQAEVMLPSVVEYRNGGGLNLGRASRGAAKSLLGKVYLYKKDYALAKSKLKEVIESGDYDLTPNYVDLFWPQGENGNESIFEIQYQSNDADIRDLNKYINFCTMPVKSNMYYKGGFNYINPTQYYVDQFETVNGFDVSSTYEGRIETTEGPYDTLEYTSESLDPGFDAGNPMNERDPRLRFTILYEGSPYFDEEFIPRTGQTDANHHSDYSRQSNYATVKYINGEIDERIQSRQNQIVIRFADVLLLYAEACIETGAGDLGSATIAINRVRQRSSVNMPSVENVGLAQGIDIAGNQDNLREYLRRERYRELAFEFGHLFADMKRWDVFKEEMENYWIQDRDGFTGGAIGNFKKEWYLWPIPITELDANNLDQNPGY